MWATSEATAHPCALSALSKLHHPKRTEQAGITVWPLPTRLCCFRPRPHVFRTTHLADDGELERQKAELAARTSEAEASAAEKLEMANSVQAQLAAMEEAAAATLTDHHGVVTKLKATLAEQQAAARKEAAAAAALASKQEEALAAAAALASEQEEALAGLHTEIATLKAQAEARAAKNSEEVAGLQAKLSDALGQAADTRAALSSKVTQMNDLKQDFDQAIDELELPK